MDNYNGPERRRNFDYEFGELKGTVKAIFKDVEEIKAKLDKKYVTQEEFRPVKLLVFGVTGLMLTAVIVALLALVLR